LGDLKAEMNHLLNINLSFFVCAIFTVVLGIYMRTLWQVGKIVYNHTHEK